MSGRAGGKDIVSADISVYKADDGTLLNHSLEIYHTPSQAQTRMQTMVKKAKKVVEQGGKLDDLGKTIGERAVIVSERSEPVIVWREDRYLYIIRSKKLDYALAFEKQLDKTRMKRN